MFQIVEKKEDYKFTCDICKKVYEGDSMTPIDWIMIGVGSYKTYHYSEDWHFCSTACAIRGIESIKHFVRCIL